MIESPLLQRMIAKSMQGLIQYALTERFGPLPKAVVRHLREIIDERKLRRLNGVAVTCADLQAFREALLARTPQGQAQRARRKQG
jgi:hypothetical protein